MTNTQLIIKFLIGVLISAVSSSLFKRKQRLSETVQLLFYSVNFGIDKLQHSDKPID